LPDAAQLEIGKLERRSNQPPLDWTKLADDILSERLLYLKDFNPPPPQEDSPSEGDLPFGLTLYQQSQTVSRFLPSIGGVRERKIPDHDQWCLLNTAIQRGCKLTKDYVQTQHRDPKSRGNICARLRKNLEYIQLTFGVPSGSKFYVLREVPN